MKKITLAEREQLSLSLTTNKEVKIIIEQLDRLEKERIIENLVALIILEKS